MEFQHFVARYALALEWFLDVSGSAEAFRLRDYIDDDTMAIAVSHGQSFQLFAENLCLPMLIAVHIRVGCGKSHTKICFPKQYPSGGSRHVSAELYSVTPYNLYTCNQ